MNQNLKSIGMNIASVALAVAIGVPLGNVLLKQFRPTPPVPSLAPIAMSTDTATLLFEDKSTELVVFGDTKCIYCKEGIALLDQLGAKYKVYYIDQDPQAKKIYETLNTGGVPVLVSKRQYVTGFSKSVWEEFMKGAQS